MYMLVDGIPTDVDNDREAPSLACFGDRFVCYKVWNLRIKIDAVDEGVHIKELVKRSPVGDFWKIPL